MASRRGERNPSAKPARGFVAYMKERHDPLTGLLLTVPVFLLYHLGVLSMRLRNGVDLVSSLTFELLDRSLAAYVGVTLGYAAAIALAVYVLRRKGKLRPAELLPVIGESVAFSVVMFLVCAWTTEQLLDWQVGPHAMGPFEKLVMSAGAGFHEELVFRVGLFAGGTLALRKLAKLSEAKAALIAALVSSVLFSAVHYVGSLGDEVELVSFTFRVVAGIYLAAVYRFRGFAVAVYTHTFYDLIVFFLLQ